MDAAAVHTALKTVGQGLARLLSYAYGGFLALVIFSILSHGRAGEFIKDLGWEVDVVACIVIGAGIYRAHRSAVIPIHHWIGCFLFWVWDKLNHISEEETVSPTRWFHSKSLGVPRYRRMLAYNVLRHDPEFMDAAEQERLDLKHAEYGLVVMAAEGCFVAFAYARSSDPSSHAWLVWLGVCVLLVAASYPAPLQEHATECLRWRNRENEETNKDGLKARPVSTTLKKYGLLKIN